MCVMSILSLSQILAGPSTRRRSMVSLGETFSDQGGVYPQDQPGGGAFVCGESTALMASLEGRVGEPRAKYVHTVEHGLWDQPVTSTMSRLGPMSDHHQPRVAWYTSIGTSDQKDKDFFSRRKDKQYRPCGSPMGITLRQIIYDIVEESPAQAVQGDPDRRPSGGCIPETLLDLPVDFDRLQEAGSMMDQAA